MRPEKGNYISKLPNYGDKMTVEEYLGNVEAGGFIDYDGSGNPSNGDFVDEKIDIFPSEGDTKIPLDATHIIWFNR